MIEYDVLERPVFDYEDNRCAEIRQSIITDSRDRICNTCKKEDVCMYKGELAQAAKDITEISKRVNVFIKTEIECKKWLGQINDYRGKRK